MTVDYIGGGGRLGGIGEDYVISNGEKVVCSTFTFVCCTFTKWLSTVLLPYITETLCDLARLAGNIGDLNLLRLKHKTITSGREFLGEHFRRVSRITCSLYAQTLYTIFKLNLNFHLIYCNSPNLPAIVLFFLIGGI